MNWWCCTPIRKCIQRAWQCVCKPCVSMHRCTHLVCESVVYDYVGAFAWGIDVSMYLCMLNWYTGFTWCCSHSIFVSHCSDTASVVSFVTSSRSRTRIPVARGGGSCSWAKYRCFLFIWVLAVVGIVCHSKPGIFWPVTCLPMSWYVSCASCMTCGLTQSYKCETHSKISRHDFSRWVVPSSI